MRRFAALLFATVASASAQSVITTAAGTEWIFPGDGKPAASAPIGRISNVITDPQGNLIFADRLNHMVMRVTPGGILSVIAGNGIAAYSGDGGPATSASLNSPFDVALDGQGNLYIADTSNNRVRKVTPDGTISTVAGTGIPGFSGDGGQAAGAKLFSPSSVAVDSTGVLYINDRDSHVIRRVAANSVISTFAGTRSNVSGCPVGNAASIGLNAPQAMAVDAARNLYIADFGNHCVLKITPDGVASRLIGTGTANFSPDGTLASQALITSPGGIAVAGAFLYLVETGNQLVRRIDTTTGRLTTVAGIREQGFSGDGGDPLKARFRNPFGVAVDSSGNLFVADRDNYRIRKVASSTISTFAGNGQFQVFPDGTPATSGFLVAPAGLAIDGTRNLYVADSDKNRVYKVTPAGRMSLFAGNGAKEYSGDGGQAVNAGLALPSYLAVDSGNNLYIADTDSNVIRMVTPAGLISTVAGNAKTGVGAEGVPAKTTPVMQPGAVLVDSNRNLYIAESCTGCGAGSPSDLHRIRKVTPDGIISTIAGSTRGNTDGPGSTARFYGPVGLALDAAGNLYVADQGTGRIRKIDSLNNVSTVVSGLNQPSSIAVDSTGALYFTEAGSNLVRRFSGGRLTTIAGTGAAGFSGDGGAPLNATFRAPFGIQLDAAGNIYVADLDNGRVRALLTTAPSFDLSAASVNLTAKSTGPLSEAQIVGVTPTVTGLPFTASATNAPWLRISPSSGVLPTALQLTADPTTLQAGTYTATVTITSPVSNPAAKTFTVALTVTASEAPKLTVDRKDLQYSYGVGSQPLRLTVNASNTGGGSIGAALFTSTTDGGSWLQAAVPPPAITPQQPAAIPVTADPTGLAPGTYNGALLLSPDKGDPVTIRVTMSITDQRPSFQLLQSGLRFTTVAGGGAPLPQSFGVKNGAQGGLNFTVDTQTLSGGGWLQVSPQSGAADSSQIDAQNLTVSVDPSGLDTGEYYAQLVLKDDNAVNSPQSLPVVLRVLPASQNPGPDLSASGFAFTGTPGSSPGSQTLQIANVTASPLSYTAGVTTEGGTWLTVAPFAGTIAPASSTRIVLQADFSKLTAGVRSGKLTLRFSDGSVRTIDILGIVSTGALDGTASLGKDAERGTSAGCSRQTIIPQFLAPLNNSTVVTLQSVPLRVQVLDNCGSPITSNSTLLVVLGNHDRDESLTYSNGVWTGTWQPRSTLLTQVDVTVIAVLNTSPPLVGRATRIVNLTTGTGVPVVSRGAIQNSASVQDSTLVAPGSLITIRGDGFGNGPSLAGTLPLPTKVSDTQVFLQGVPLPLLDLKNGQINAQVPFNVTANALQQLLVVRTDTLSPQPEILSVAPAQPGIFTVNEQGSGQGYIYRVADDGTQTLADASNPAAAGDQIAILCAGLGAVTPGVPAGTQPPASPRATVVNPVAVTIGGLPAQVVTATLRPDPDLSGRYEVVVIVPPGVSPGDNSITLTVMGQTSNSATFAVR